VGPHVALPQFEITSGTTLRKNSHWKRVGKKKFCFSAETACGALFCQRKFSKTLISFCFSSASANLFFEDNEAEEKRFFDYGVSLLDNDPSLLWFVQNEPREFDKLVRSHLEQGTRVFFDNGL